MSEKRQAIVTVTLERARGRAPVFASRAQRTRARRLATTTRLGAVALGLTLLAPARAQAQSLPVIVFNDFKYAVTDVLAVWSSPFRGDGRDYLTAGKVIAGIAAVSLLDRDIGQWIRDHPEAGVLEVLKPFREGHATRLVNLGAGKSLLQLSGSLYLLGLVTGNADLRDAAVGCTAAEKSNGVARHWIYKGVSRERPLFRETTDTDTTERLGDPHRIRFPGEETWFDNSFFGGHGANVMSCASFFSHRFDLGYAEPVIYAVATGINLGRMADQRHWASDVATGAIVGFAMGKYVAERSKRRADRREGGRTGRDDEPGAAAEHAAAERSFLDGLYLEQVGGRTVVGWKRKF